MTTELTIADRIAQAFLVDDHTATFCNRMGGRMGKIRILCPCILFLALILFSTSAMPETTLRLATVDNFPPFTFLDKGRLTGVDVDVVYEIARRINLKVMLEAYPWVRVLEYVRDGTVDGGFSAFQTEQRMAYCLYAGVLHYEEFHVFVKKGNEFPFSNITDLYGKTVGKDIGVYISKAFEQAAKDGMIRVEKVTDMDLLNLKKLSMGRLDAMIGDYGVTHYHAKRLNLDTEIVSIGPIHEKQAAYLILSKKSALPNKKALQQKIISTLEQIRRDGTYQSILDRYATVGQIQ